MAPRIHERVLRRWEALPARWQVGAALPAALIALLALHLALFPHLGVGRSATYAVMEAIPVALIVTFATQTELARRERAARRDGDDHVP